MLDRRTVLQTMSAAAPLSAAPGLGRATAPTVRPPRRCPGDTAGLIEPAGFTDDSFDLEPVKATIRAMGLVPKAAPHLDARRAGRRGVGAGPLRIAERGRGG